MANVEARPKAIKVDWTKDLVNCLIENYEVNPCLYDVSDKFNTNKHARNDALLKITSELQKIDPRVDFTEVKKLISMRQQFAHENAKILESYKSGMGFDDMYEPSIWWFEKMLFLAPHIKNRKSSSSLDSLNKTSNSSVTMIEDEASTSKSPTLKEKKRKLLENEEVLIQKTVATLDKLEKNLNPEKSDAQIYGEHVAREMEKIKNEEIITDLIHNINNCIYDAKNVG